MYKPPKRRKLSKAERQEVYDKCGGHCAYCGCEITIKQMQVDHVQPISVNGEDVMGNYLPACRSCNNYKHSMTLETFRAMAEKWHDSLMRDSAAYRIAFRFGRVVPKTGRVEFYFEQEAHK
jgi:5-methylcytosine-specific restriction endonuclease McrA